MNKKSSCQGSIWCEENIKDVFGPEFLQNSYPICIGYERPSSSIILWVIKKLNLHTDEVNKSPSNWNNCIDTSYLHYLPELLCCITPDRYDNQARELDVIQVL